MLGHSRPNAEFTKKFIHSAVCLTTVPWPLPKRDLHRVRSSASSFNFQYLLFPLRSSSRCLRLHPRLPVISILPSNFPSITCFRRQFLRKITNNDCKKYTQSDLNNSTGISEDRLIEVTSSNVTLRNNAKRVTQSQATSDTTR
jgi:hypothetical protein